MSGRGKYMIVRVGMDANYHIAFVGFRDPDCDRSILLDAIGRYRTNLFCDFNKSRHEDFPPIYTMRERPSQGLPSAYQIYMYSDSEYDAALKLVGSWQHWERLLKSKPFVHGMDDGGQWVGLQRWRDEKEVKERAVAYNQLRINAAGGQVQAQKMIFDGRKETSKRGRPTAEEVRKVAQEQAKNLREIKDDFKRVKLVMDNGISTRDS